MKPPCASDPPDHQHRRGSQLAGECWCCGKCVKAHFKNKFECLSAAEAVLTLFVKFPCTRPSTKSCDLKALTKDERDSMERPFISVWYLSIMDHLPCSKIRRRTSLQHKKENKIKAVKSWLMYEIPFLTQDRAGDRKTVPRSTAMG